MPSNPYGFTSGVQALVLASESNSNQVKISIPSTAKPSFFLLCAINDEDVAGSNVVMFGANDSNIHSTGTDANGDTTVEPSLHGGSASCSVTIPGTGWFYLVEFSSDTVSAPGGIKAFLDGVAAGGTTTSYPTFTAQSDISFLDQNPLPHGSKMTIMGFTILKTVPTAAQVTEIRTKMSAVIPAHIAATDPRIGRKTKFHEHFASSLGSFYVSPKPSLNDNGQFGRFKFLDSSASEFGFQPVSIITDVGASDGKALQIQAKWLGSAMNSWSTDPKFQWLSALISTCDLNRGTGTIDHITGFPAGYFFARMKMPANNPYTWPAFWLLNKDGVPVSPTHSMEIDAIEQKGPEPKGYAGYYHQWVNSGGSTGTEGTAVFLGAMGLPTSGAGPEDLDLTADYHDYGALITGTNVTLYCDHKPVKDGSGNVITYSLLDTGMAGRGDKLFLLIDLAGNEDNPTPPTPSTGETHELLVDYVKVYV